MVTAPVKCDGTANCDAHPYVNAPHDVGARKPTPWAHRDFYWGVWYTDGLPAQQ